MIYLRIYIYTDIFIFNEILLAQSKIIFKEDTFEKYHLVNIIESYC